jgi:hypothetical protein
MTNELTALMEALAARRGWPAPQPAAGRYDLVIDLELELSLFQVDGDLYVEGQVMTLPRSGPEREALLRKLLGLQVARSRDHAEVLTLSEQPAGSNEPPGGPPGQTVQPREIAGLVIYRRLPVAGLSLAAFEEALGAFANALSFWIRAAAQTPAPLAPPPGATMLFP